jgi:hypothetical protein
MHLSRGLWGFSFLLGKVTDVVCQITEIICEDVLTCHQEVPGFQKDFNFVCNSNVQSNTYIYTINLK